MHKQRYPFFVRDMVLFPGNITIRGTKSLRKNNAYTNKRMLVHLIEMED
jgi:hypothetical protein